MYQRDKSDCNYAIYKRALNRATRECRRSKLNFEKMLASNIKSDSKSFYSYVRSKSNSKESVGPLIDSSGNVVSDELQQAQLLNNFFSSVFTVENMNSFPRPLNIFHGSDNDKLVNCAFSPDQVLDILDKLKPDKAAVVGNIHPKYLREARLALVDPLCIIFRKFLDEGFVPSDWRRANVTPVFKKGPKSSCGNYRPISLTSQICKVFELMIRAVVVNHLEKFNLIRDSQHGFLSGRSCTTNLLAFLEEVTLAVDSGIPVDVIYLDFAKAFDKVPIKIGSTWHIW